MGGKGHEAKPDSNPGPGAYTSALKKYLGPSYKIGTASKSHKELSSKKEVPGPGQYSPEKHQYGPSYGFTRGGRHERTSSEGPGPGSYMMYQVIGREGAKHTMGGRPDTSPGRADGPGPGAYDFRRSYDGPGFKMGTETR